MNASDRRSDLDELGGHRSVRCMANQFSSESTVKPVREQPIAPAETEFAQCLTAYVLTDTSTLMFDTVTVSVCWFSGEQSWLPARSIEPSYRYNRRNSAPKGRAIVKVMQRQPGYLCHRYLRHEAC